jgi:hypothetical protein
MKSSVTTTIILLPGKLTDLKAIGRPFGKVLFLVVVALLLAIALPAQSISSNLSFSAIPISDPDFAAPFRGANHWNRFMADWSTSQNQVPLPYPRARDSYYRFRWSEIQTEPGVYNWTYFDRWVRNAIDNRAKFSFGIMPVSQGEGYMSVGGARLDFPLYLHNQMQSEANKDWIANGMWIPNWNSPSYLSACRSLLAAVRDHLNNTTYNGVRFVDAIGYQDIRLYGNWGEWHNWPYEYSTPAGRVATSATLNTLIDYYLTMFPDMFLVSMVSGYKAGGSASTPVDVSYKLLTASTSKGKLGWRWDTFGDNDYADVFEGNTGSYNGMRFDTAIVNRWRYAPIVGEPSSWYDGVSNNGASSAYYRLIGTPRGQEGGQVEFYHVSMIGNGNYSSVSDAAMRSNIIEASKKMGYRIVLEGGGLSGQFQPGGSISVNLRWRNVGVAPVYEDWDVVFELQDQNSGTVRWRGNSLHELRLWLPSGTATNVTDNFVLPASLPSGTYRLVLKISDPKNYREPLPLAIRGRRTDGSYLLRSDIVVSASGVVNAAPVVNAGADQRIQLPEDSAIFAGTAVDADGAVNDLLWTKVSGPASGVIANANTLSARVSNLQVGTYVFRLTATDNIGATTYDEVNIVVAAPPSPPPNAPPFANAGTDISVTLPADNISLTGTASDTDGTVASVNWTKLSGPAGGVIQSPSSISTIVGNLNPGTYVFRLTVTDNIGAIATDEVSVVVSGVSAPSPTNQPPVANAGADRNITLPTNSLTLTGTATDPDGSVATYAWSKVSGPSGGNVQSPNAASSQVTAMIAGTYVFRLTVTDNNGAIGTDDVQVIVNPAPAAAGNQAPIANAGVNITITLPTSAATLDGSGTDPDGTIASYSWTQVSGPAGGTIQAATAASTQVSGMIAGTYVFRLTVRDNLGAQGTDDVQIVVNPAPVPVNQAPVANAGRDITITLPIDTAQLNGSGSRDADGSIASYSWRKVSGPAGGTLSNPRIANPVSRGMMQGTYIFELLVTDNLGATHTDQMTITVIRINKRPVLASIDTVNVMLPVQNTELSAAGSYDPDGTITSYQWTYVTGPTTPRMLSPRNSRTVVTDLQEGTYRFRVEATDNDGDRSSKAVVVIVSPNNGRRIIPEVDVYPNPASSVVNIQVTSELNGRTTLTFYDMNGRPVMTDVFTKATRRQTRQVNIDLLPKGAYGVIIQVDQAERVVEKVIKF